MQILIANAKIMHDRTERLPWTEPQFQSIANRIALNMAGMDIDKLESELDCSRSLAAENWQRYQNFFIANKMPAIMAYNGQAYKHLKAHTLDDADLKFAQDHLWITCFLYGLLRPMDGVVPYRMEHCVHLPSVEDIPVNRFWRDTLTDVLIDSVKADDGIILHLSTEEYEHLFDWKRVCQEVTVVHPLFYVRQKNGNLKMQAVWAKSCRGAMLRYILTNRITSPNDLSGFSYEGFEYAPLLGEPTWPHFVRELKLLK